ncbi:protein TOPLESS-like isoform X3 [Alnus glutinosa]|uniref:protein TOPLESS-like isoform X3 n=1 Tax=Alnus glutinosa TaxID=3517 RepID=UPI002D78BECF|nr:protein TOPLESS-like isoform X3 [Alnus glutinosa]
MSTLSKELVFLILQFLEEEGFRKTAHLLERESGFYFDMKYFEDLVLGGEWDEAERYFSGFTSASDNKHSTKVYFEIRKQNFLEALDSNDREQALGILMKSLKVFAPDHEELFKEMTLLLTFNDIREHDALSGYGDTKSERMMLMCDLKKIIEANPIFHGKLKFPSIQSQRLRRLINQSLNWQHMRCKDPHPNPNIKTLFVDHVCQPQHNFSCVQSTENNSLPSQATSSPVPTSDNWNSSQSTITKSAFLGAVCPGAPKNTATAVEVLEDSDQMSTGRPSGTLDDATSTVTSPGQSHCSVSIPNDLPKTVTRTLNEETSPMSMDFHPVQQTVLLVGTCAGDVGLWNVRSGEKLLSRNFKVWDIEACSMTFKAALLNDSYVSVNRIMWAPDGSLFGVAYSKHIVQLFSYHGGDDMRQQLEIDAHVGGVNDLAFAAPHRQLLVITCGDDKMIKVWDVVTGAKQFAFDGHDAPVYSVYPHIKENIHVVFSTSVDGKIKLWLYDALGARVDHDAPGLGCTKMAYSADGKSKDGQSFLIEWNENEGIAERIYQGLGKCPSSIVQFTTIKNQILAAADNHMIKFWDMDHVELLTTIDGDGGLPANPHICFNKEGTLLAVSANENRIKILATDYGLQLLQTSENCSGDASQVLSETLRKLVINPITVGASAGVADAGHPMDGDAKNLNGVESKSTREVINKSKVWKLLEINSDSQCQSLRLPKHVKTNKISRLIYTHSGNAILALSSNAIHLLWKWPQNYLNSSGKATTKVPPLLWQPKSGLQLMSNELTGPNTEEAVSCFALSKNDSYLMSASGGMISLFNMITFQTMKTIMRPPPAATCIAFHPQDNNIVAIGMDNSMVLIYNVRLGEVKSKLEGHSKRVTGLAFSNALNVLVSSGADSQLFVWNSVSWEKCKSRLFQMPCGKLPTSPSDTHVQFHQDQNHFLAVHKAHLGIYEARELTCIKQWVSGEFSAPISDATFSCDNQMVYASFVDGSVAIFDALNLDLHCRINPTAYVPCNASSNVYPHAIAAHPHKPTQFAVGLTDGEVYVFEPQEVGGRTRNHKRCKHRSYMTHFTTLQSRHCNTFVTLLSTDKETIQIACTRKNLCLSKDSTTHSFVITFLRVKKTLYILALV